MYGVVTQGQFIIGKAGLLPAKDEGNTLLPGIPMGDCSRFSGCHRRPSQAAVARRAPEHKRTALQRFGKTAPNLGLSEHIVGTRGHRGRLGSGETLGIDQVQSLQCHGFHGPGGGADVARMGGLDQNDSDIC